MSNPLRLALLAGAPVVLAIVLVLGRDWLQPAQPVLPTPTTPTTAPPPPGTPAAVESCAAPAFFQKAYAAHPELGCPTVAAKYFFDYQEFERGVTLWHDKPMPTVYAFYRSSRRWESVPDPGGPPHPSCQEGNTTGNLGPIFAFGTLWCAPWNWKSRLGNPTNSDSQGGPNPIQDFANGTILSSGAAGTFILYPNGIWEPFAQ